MPAIPRPELCAVAALAVPQSAGAAPLPAVPRPGLYSAAALAVPHSAGAIL